MSALAKLLWHEGFAVVGSDAVESVNTKELSKIGIRVYIGHSASNIEQEKVDCLVINGAIVDDNPELLYAQKNGLKVVYREDLLAQIARKYQNVIAVAGCHGKSSTTALTGLIFRNAGCQPTIHNGVQDNLHLGGKQWFITEACEFRKSFLKLKPQIAIITNVDADHLDCYRDLTEIKKSFARFATQSEILIKNASDKNSLHLNGKKRTITFGIDKGDVHTKKLRKSVGGGYNFDLVIDSRIFGVVYQIPRVQINVPGIHNVLNALAAITCALVCKIDLSSVIDGVGQFKGIARRFQHFAHIGKTSVILDYAHHPRELFTTIQTANCLYHKYLLVFQPHTYTRTISLWNDFLEVFRKIPNLIFYKTYAARGKPIIGGRALDLSRALKAPYFTNTRQVLAYLQKNASDYDAIILCGAGDVVNGEFLQNASFVTFD